MLDRDEQLGRIIAAWTERGVNDDTTVTELAAIALTALECGETHPDRSSVRCTQLPHGNGHLFHRNSGLGLEWWANGDRTATIHDVLGRIHLIQSLATVDPQEATRPVSCPECQWIRQDGRDHGQLIGGWLRCAHCGHEWNGPESRPSTWCRAKHPHFDMYCDTLHHPLNTRRHGSSIYGVQWTDPHDPAESDQRGRYHTLPPCEDDTEDPTDVDLTVTTAEDRAVYRDLIPLLGPVATFLDRMGKRYREGNPRMTSELCRTAEDHRDHLHKVIDTLQEVVISDELPRLWCYRCRKWTYPSRKVARRVRKTVNPGDPMDTYRCRSGDGWHIGHSSE